MVSGVPAVLSDYGILGAGGRECRRRGDHDIVVVVVVGFWPDVQVVENSKSKARLNLGRE